MFYDLRDIQLEGGKINRTRSLGKETSLITGLETKSLRIKHLRHTLYYEMDGVRCQPISEQVMLKCMDGAFVLRIVKVSYALIEYLFNNRHRFVHRMKGRRY